MANNDLTHSNAPTTNATWNAQTTHGRLTSNSTGAINDMSINGRLSALEKWAASSNALRITGVSRTTFI
jgi:hypothetical protein